MGKNPPTLLFLLLAVMSSPDIRADTGDVGEIAVIEDTTGQIHSNMLLPPAFCREAANVFYQTHADDYDSIIAFTTKTLNFMENVYQGSIVKTDIQGIGLMPMDLTSNYGSAGRLMNCVKMGMIDGLPDDPDSTSTYTYHLTGVEILAHEFSHVWLMWLNYDKGDGGGVQDLLRGYESDSPNGHWNHYADSRSVMYGSCITDLGGGQFELAGCDRFYNDLELYAMGLLPTDQAEPVWFVDVGEPHGNPSLPLRKDQTDTAAGLKVEVTVDDVLRAMGTRVPAAADAPKRFRVAFVLVSPQGEDAPSALIDKVDMYRRRFEEWFSWATGGLGSLDTQLDPSGEEVVPVDGGSEDGGGEEPVLPADDGGVLEETATPDDPGPGPDETAGGEDASGSDQESGPDLDQTKEDGGCGCAGNDRTRPAPAALLTLAFIPFLARRRGQ